MPAAGANNPRPGEVVVLVGLQRAAQHNYAAASVLDAAADSPTGRWSGVYITELPSLLSYF